MLTIKFKDYFSEVAKATTTNYYKPTRLYRFSVISYQLSVINALISTMFKANIFI
ncbi:MAG: hypothetical protein VSS75_001195 [Candidatus Parabeggiatoa sp.]|nr:hypothetical protein [Candidatus Parabeggiatoa sp.]